MYELKNPPYLSVEKQLICRQYHEKWKFRDYNEVIKKLQCNHILSFSSCPIPSDLQDNDVPVSTCKFSNKHKELLAVANENGIVCIENIKNVEALKYIQTHKNTVYDIAWMPCSSQFVTVSGDNSAKLWDCRESNVDLISTFMGHKRSVRCVSFKPDNTAVFATGSRDGSLMLWDARAWKKCAKFSHHLPDQIIASGAGSPSSSFKKNGFSLELLNCRSVTGLVFQNDNTLISCGSMDRFIRVWDMRKTYSRSASNTVAKYQLASPNSGFSYLCMNALGTKLYANCMDSYIYCFNINSYDPDPVAAFYGHTNKSFYVKSSVSLDGLYLMSGSSDEAAYIWNTRHAELSEEAVKPFVVLNSHSAEVTCVEICPDNMIVVTCSDDGTFRLWNPYKLKNDIKENRDTAAYFDEENLPVVKTRWKNKRKFNEMNESDPENFRISSYASHTKICRFYSINHSSPCICQVKFTQGKAEKRANDGSSKEKEIIKKLAIIQMQEITPPRNSDCKNTIFSPELQTKTTPKLHYNVPVKPSLKRKLEDTPAFRDEVHKNKKMNCGGILTPLNLLGKNKKQSDGSGDTSESKKKVSETSIKDFFENTSEHEGSETKKSLSALSSPTSNLPNYVEDGTSPYLHKCPKFTQKENDWLTKLREHYKPKKIPEEKLPSSTDVSSVLEKRKKSKPVEYTLHKYFKVSSKGMEKSFSIQESQRKGILSKLKN